MRPDRLRILSLSTVEVTPKTRWTFLEVETEAGLRGVGEASLAGHEAEIAEAAARLAPIAFALPDLNPGGLPRRLPASLPEAAALSALDQALWDISARRQGVALAEALGGTQRAEVPVYANINRRTRERRPEAFAQSARAAIAAGHKAIKLAPFDEVLPGSDAKTLVPGLARLAAVREATGPTIRLMIDCHWRFDPGTAERVIAAAAELGVDWIECPLVETPATAEAIARLRRTANRHDILLAGLETGIGVEGFAPYLRAGAYDVMMPDIKYVGGLAEVLRLAETLRGAGIGFSPHNPSGPICHAASLHLCAAVPELHSLEVQFDETPLFAELVDADLQQVRGGTIAAPGGTGLGVTLQAAVAERYGVRQWQATRTGTKELQEGTWIS
ncbi:mandelate racemase/muconate lactonizing enzyme family protein [Sphingomonas sp. R-74633]|uniref:mandelate racemase/muconate lactonizing enzyme family protein n=1 Tax=Sphingomonas sp. R-74633 TaxID=2751188 RepID=UPI0015D2AEA6|nr:mandelate racemase/muconate lactonizing enzyme family protein [Sphingomonas sp. R-74633]NYT41932.1 mandelate racemase/muconate lactonizing enzyme family protein [Sphingomonas sp. R-74633]